MEIEILHARTPDHRSELATGMTCSMLPDDMVQLTFFRDSARIKSEKFAGTVPADAPEGTAIALAPVPGSTAMEHVREDVASMLIPAGRFDLLLNAMNEFRATHPAFKAAG